MSQANELLDSLTTDEIAAYSADSASEPHIVIGSDRYITVPESLKRIGVQFDHNVETVTFDCPRYWDGLDMSKMIVYINYLLPSGIRAAYIAENIAVDESDDTMMHFTWTISNHVTMTKGTLSFLVCIKKTDSEGNEVNHWNSELNREMFISEGMECEEIALSEYPDIITQLLTRMTAVEEINIQAEEMETLVTQANGAAQFAIMTKNEIQEIKRDIDDSAAEIRDSYANAVKGNVSGEVVCVDDVSPIEHSANVWVRGKNLCSVAGFDNSNSSTRILNTSGIRVKKGKTYTFQCKATYVSDTENDKRIQFVISSDKSQNATNINVSNELAFLVADSIFTTGAYANSVTATVDGYLYVRIVASNVFTLINIQIEEGEIATEYEPYLDPTTVTLTRYGVDETDNPQTYTPNADGTVEVKSLSPIMTLLTDTEGVTIDLEYNRDTTKMFESYVLTDKAKSEIAGIVESDMAEVLAALNEYAEAIIGGNN